MSEIKWAYDERTGSFSALPASPFLLVALSIIAFLPFIEKAYYRHKHGPKEPDATFDNTLHEQYRKRWKELQAKKAAGQTLSWQESAEIMQMMHPPWSKPEDGIWVYD